MQWNEPYRNVDQFLMGVTPSRVIHLHKRYMPGLGDIKVYFNGVSAVKGREYEETDAYTLTFNFDFEPDDIVEVEYLKMW